MIFSTVSEHKLDNRGATRQFISTVVFSPKWLDFRDIMKSKQLKAILVDIRMNYLIVKKTPNRDSSEECIGIDIDSSNLTTLK